VNPRHACRAVAILGVGSFFMATILSPQQTTNRLHIGIPQDWSQRHIVFSRDGLLQHPEVLYQEPRVLHQAIQRWQGRDSSVVHGMDAAPAPSAISNQLDWSVSLGGRNAANMFPAKFSFNPGVAPSCTGDYVAFGLTVPGTPGASGGTANLVAFNNLYAGAGGLCGAAPSVMFGYNVTTVPGGGIATSPVLSDDGTKIAFVESALSPATSIFHVLTWTAGQGSTGSAVAPTNMMSLPLAADSSTTSSPFVDYNADVAYVGADNGNLYKITGVFHGTPTLAGGNWPITVSANARLTSPVLDASRGLLLVGSANGILYQIDTTSGTITHTLAVGLTGGGRINPGIWAAPIIDVSSGTAFVVSSNDGTSGVLVEVDTTTLAQLAKARIGQASTNPGRTAVNLFEPAFSDTYYTNPSSPGALIRLCGTGAADTTPWQYAFGFSGITPPLMKTTPAFSQQLLTSTAARCTGWTEFFNPNIGAGGTDFFFFGLNRDCTGNGYPAGCVVSRASDTLLIKATLNGGSNGIVVDNYSPVGQASSIYLMAGRLNKAYKFTQNGLN
jgi:hypothetical protein